MAGSDEVAARYLSVILNVIPLYLGAPDLLSYLCAPNGTVDV